MGESGSIPSWEEIFPVSWRTRGPARSSLPSSGAWSLVEMSGPRAPGAGKQGSRCSHPGQAVWPRTSYLASLSLSVAITKKTTVSWARLCGCGDKNRSRACRWHRHWHSNSHPPVWSETKPDRGLLCPRLGEEKSPRSSPSVQSRAPPPLLPCPGSAPALSASAAPSPSSAG